MRDHRIQRWGGYLLGEVHDEEGNHLFDHFQCRDGSVFLIVEPDSQVSHEEITAYKLDLARKGFQFEYVPEGRQKLRDFPADDPLLKAAIDYLLRRQ